MDFMSGCPPISDDCLRQLRIEPARSNSLWATTESRARFIVRWDEAGPAFSRQEGLRVCAQDSSLKGCSGPEFLRVYGRMFAREGFCSPRADDMVACSGREPCFVVFYRPLGMGAIAEASRFGGARMMWDLDPPSIAASLLEAWEIAGSANHVVRADRIRARL